MQEKLNLQIAVKYTKSTIVYLAAERTVSSTGKRSIAFHQQAIYDNFKSVFRIICKMPVWEQFSLTFLFVTGDLFLIIFVFTPAESQIYYHKTSIYFYFIKSSEIQEHIDKISIY